MIDKNKKYKTRDGLKVRIYATDAGGDSPVHGSIFKDGVWIQESWSPSGYCDLINCRLSEWDLVEFKPRIKIKVWVNVYPGGGGTLYASKEEADSVAADSRLACIEITIDCEEGEGL